MRKVHVEAQYGFHNCHHKEDFEFPDEYTDEQIEDELYEWAAQFIDIHWEEDKDIDEDDDEDDEDDDVE